MVLTAILCKHCGDIVYSRTRHDMRFCSCGRVAIDGGREYAKITFENFEDFEQYVLDLNISQDTLAKDWNLNLDNYGIIHSATK